MTSDMPSARPLLFTVTFALSCTLCFGCSDEKLKAIGDTCSKDDECASGRCDELRCKDAVGQPQDAACSHPLECASGNCVYTATSSYCGPGQRPAGEICSDDAQCQSGLCAQGHCAPVPEGGVPDAGADAACSCPNVEDTCLGGVCYRSETSCDLITPCPTGYRCDKGRCACTTTGCSAPCDDDAPCAPAICAGDGVCRPPLPCSNPFSCPAGFACRVDDRWQTGDVLTCGRVGPLTDGSPCSVPAECASGICITGRCLTPCRASSDCGAGRYCHAGTTRSGETIPFGVCIAFDECDGQCPAEAQCLSGNSCLTFPCFKTGDCAPAEVCYFGPGNWAGECGSVGLPCGTEDAFYDPMQACFENLACYNDDDCGPGYSCQIADLYPICVRNP